MKKDFIDKIALIAIKDRKLLGTLSRGKDTWYIPGGKREEGESDTQTLVREIREELAVEIDPLSLQLFGVFEAQAHGKPKGIMVRITCYQATFMGNPKPSHEIKKIQYFSFEDRHLFSEVNQYTFAELKKRNLID